MKQTIGVIFYMQNRHTTLCFSTRKVFIKVNKYRFYGFHLFVYHLRKEVALRFTIKRNRGNSWLIYLFIRSIFALFFIHTRIIIFEKTISKSHYLLFCHAFYAIHTCYNIAPRLLLYEGIHHYIRAFFIVFEGFIIV